jgi:hypothetical protein
MYLYVKAEIKRVWPVYWDLFAESYDSISPLAAILGPAPSTAASMPACIVLTFQFMTTACLLALALQHYA